MAFSLFKKGLVECFPSKKWKFGINLVLANGYAIKSNLPVRWIKPEKIPCIDPRKSGDLAPLEKVDTSLLAPDFRDLNELKDADENVRKMFSLSFLPYKETVEHARQEYLNKVKRHILDKSSPEARLAKMTADIRDMQRFHEEFPRDRRTKVRLKETIDKRRRLLKFLRTQDYKCFEYCLEKLGLVYKPDPGPDVWKRVERKRSLRMLTEKYCENVVQTKLSEYRQLLESQQEDFLVNKIKSLKWIQEQEAFCGVPPTITDSEIKETELKLEELRKAKGSEKVVDND